MKIYDSNNLEWLEHYFFVFNGIVYYGYADYTSYVSEDERHLHELSVLKVLDSSSYTGEREVCCAWEAELIYKL